MPVPTSIDQLSTTAASNSPSGSDSPSVLDDHLRAQASFIAHLRNATTSVGWYGAGNNSAAFQAAYDAAPAGSTIVVPPGTYSGISVTGTKRVVWDVRADTEVSPSLLNLPGVVQSQHGPARMTWEGATQAGEFALQRIDRIVSHAGGSGVSSALRVTTDVGASATNFEWGICSVLKNAAAGSAENVAIYGQGLKLPGGGNTWAGCFEARDTSNAANPTTALVGLEVDCLANGTDANGLRIGIDVVGGKGETTGVAPVIAAGIRVGPSNNTKTNCQYTDAIVVHNAAVENALKFNNITGNFGILMSGTVAVAMDTTGLTTSTAAIRLKSGHKIAFDVASELTLTRSTSAGLFQFSGGGIVADNIVSQAAFAASGSGAYGLDLTGYTASSAHIRLPAGGKIALDDTNTLTLSKSSGQFVFSGGAVYSANGFSIPSSGNVASSANSGAASVLPSVPAGYEIFKIDGTSYKRPYYNA